MDDRKGEKVFAIFLFLVMFCLIKFQETLQERNLILPVVALVFILVFGFAAYQIGKDWKKTDEEVLDIESAGQKDFVTGTGKKQLTYEDRKRFFFSSFALIAFILFREKQLDPGSLIFCGVVLVMGCGYFLPALIQKLRGKEGDPIFPKSKLPPDQLLYMLLSLFALCFAGFWIYLVLSKTGLWWFSIPGFILAFAFARPLVAGLRILLRKEKDPGEKHIRKKKEQDPWDRPDRKL